MRAETGTEADVEGAHNNIFSTALGTRYSRTMRTSLIVDPPDGRIPPLTPEVVARRAAVVEAAGARGPRRTDLPYPVDTGRSYDNPEDVRNMERCLGVSMPCIGGLCGFSRLVQGPEWVGIYYEQGHGIGGSRSIPLDGRPHLPPHIRQWLGDSVGRWDGDTLVVEVTEQIDQTWFERSGNFHSGAMRVVERYTPITPYHMQYEATMDDPEVFTEPWTISLPLYRRMEEHPAVMEYRCVEMVEELVYGHLRKEQLVRHWEGDYGRRGGTLVVDITRRPTVREAEP